jgi:HEAT repeat protein
MTAPRDFSLTDAERRRIERIDRLVLLGGTGVAELLAGLTDASWTVRRAVVAGLGQGAAVEAAPALVGLLEHPGRSASSRPSCAATC